MRRMKRHLWIDTRGEPVITTTQNGVRNAERWGWVAAVAVPSAAALAETERERTMSALRERFEATFRQVLVEREYGHGGIDEAVALADAVVEDLRAVEWIIDAVIAAHGNRISAHYEDCWKYHAGCLAVLLRDRFEEETMTEARQVDEAAVMAVIERALNAASPAMEATGRNRYKAERVARAVIEFLGECAAVAEARQVDEAVVTRVAKAICDEEIACKNTSWEFHGEHTRVAHRKQAKAALEEFLGERHEPEQPECLDHKPVQHRDGKPPWCKVCGLDARGNEPESRLGKPERDIAAEIEAEIDAEFESVKDRGPEYRKGLYRAVEIVRYGR